MAIEEEYKEGLDALLSGKISIDDALKLGGEVLYYATYIVPGVGIYRQFKKPRGERNLLGTIGFSIYTLPFVIKIALLPVWVGAGIATREWNPFNHIKSFIENIREKKESKLEKTMKYEDFPFEN